MIMTIDDRPPQPAAKRCPRCLTDHEWTWMPRVYTEGGKPYGHRWIAPPIRGLDADPSILACPVCSSSAEYEAREGKILKRLAAMNVPKRCREWRLSDLVYMEGMETESEFRHRVQADVQAYGVTEENRETVDAMIRWIEYLRRESEGEASDRSVGVYLHGPVGSGKTLLAAMVARELLGTAEMKWCRMPMDRIEQVLGRKPTPEDDIDNDRMFWGMKGTRSVPVLWVNEAELLRRQQLSWAGDPGPLARVARFDGLLVVDELGAETVPASGKPAAFKIDAIERLVCSRYDRRLPTLYTSNIPARVARGEVPSTPCPWGARVADRLRGSVACLTLKGNSWRNV